MRSRPRIFFCTVVYGANATSSWSRPCASCPFFCITPTTRNGRFITRMSWPIGSVPGNRLSASVCPITMVRAAVRTSASVKNEPVATGHLRMSGYCSLTPVTLVFQFMLPATSCERAFTFGVTIETLGTSRLIASRSSTVSVFVPVSPVPLRTPPTFCAPALTNSRFVPILSICACTDADAPWPILTIAITAATPMMMPSIVNAARILFLTSARKATRMIISKVICLLVFFFFVVLDDRQVLQLFRRITLMFDLVIALDLSILEHDDALRVFRDVRFVRHEHERDAALAIQALENLHHFH